MTGPWRRWSAASRSCGWQRFGGSKVGWPWLGWVAWGGRGGVGWGGWMGWGGGGEDKTRKGVLDRVLGHACPVSRGQLVATPFVGGSPTSLLQITLRGRGGQKFTNHFRRNPCFWSKIVLLRNKSCSLLFPVVLWKKNRKDSRI